MSQHLISTRSTEHPCRRCRQPVYTAWAEGLHVTADAAELTAAEEVAALVSARRTFTRTRSGELIYRDAGRIKSGLLIGTIHAEHKCAFDKQGELF